MAQILSGNLSPFTSGQVLTAADLNAHVNSATLLPGAITDVTNITANTVASGDSILLYDLSATALREANISDVLGSNLPVTTSAITAGANSDILVTPNDATIVTGSTYTSADGLTVVVTTAVAHGLSVGQVLLISAAGTGYNGTFRITVAAGSSFTYVMTTAATAGSGSLAYTKKATNRVSGNVVVNQNLYVDGSTAVAGSEYVAGSLTVAGATTLAGALTSNGTANFTGALQVNGTVGYVLTEIVEQDMSYTGSPAVGVWTACFTSASYTKPAGEIWVLEVDFRFKYESAHYLVFRFQQTSPSTTLHGLFKIEGGATNYFHCENAFLRYVVSDATTFTSTFTLDVQTTTAHQITVGEAAFPYSFFTGVTLPVSKFRIYKYKTA
jgi:hypothetical protein